MLENGEIKPFKKRTLFRDEIRDYIKGKILSNELKQGDRIVETRWAKELGVSQSPVREAIRELEMMGLVENRPFQGSYVREQTIKDIRDSYCVRISLETLGMRDAIASITEEQLQEIYIVMKEMETAGKNSEFDQFIRLDTLFHQKIIEVSKNKTLIRLWSQCNIREWTFIGTKRLSDRSLEYLAIRHEAIYKELKARDEEKAVKAVVAHLEELLEEMEVAQNKTNE